MLKLVDFVALQKQSVLDIMEKLALMKNITNVNETLNNTYQNKGADGWTFLGNMNEHNKKILNQLEDDNLLISRNRTFYKVKNNIIVSICCNNQICQNP